MDLIGAVGIKTKINPAAKISLAVKIFLFFGNVSSLVANGLQMDVVEK